MTEAKHITQRTVRRGDINMRLIVNREHRYLRFMDFRVGHYEEKRAFLDEVVAEQKLNKVFTLVEKQDSQNWRGVEFVREGVYPSFFRTADAYVMSRLYDADGHPLPAKPPERRPEEPKVGEDEPEPNRSGIKFDMSEDPKVIDAFMDKVDGELSILPFGRNTGPDVVLQAKSRKRSGWACAEIDDSFGHAVVALSPMQGDGPDDFVLAVAAEMVDTLIKRGVNNLFSVTDHTAEHLNRLFAFLEFRITGKLAAHLAGKDGQSSALVWHRRLNATR